MKIQLKLKPYNAITILAFCREYINDDLEEEYHFQAIKEAVAELEDQLAANLTDDAWDEITSENHVNQLIGKSPNR